MANIVTTMTGTIEFTDPTQAYRLVRFEVDVTGTVNGTVAFQSRLNPDDAWKTHAVLPIADPNNPVTTVSPPVDAAYWMPIRLATFYRCVLQSNTTGTVQIRGTRTSAGL